MIKLAPAGSPLGFPGRGTVWDLTWNWGNCVWSSGFERGPCCRTSRQNPRPAVCYTWINAASFPSGATYEQSTWHASNICRQVIDRYLNSDNSWIPKSIDNNQRIRRIIHHCMLLVLGAFAWSFINTLHVWLSWKVFHYSWWALQMSFRDALD